MEFDDVENLSVEQILELYSDTIEQGNIIAGPQGSDRYGTYDAGYDTYTYWRGYDMFEVRPCPAGKPGYCTYIDRYEPDIK